MGLVRFDSKSKMSGDVNIKQPSITFILFWLSFQIFTSTAVAFCPDQCSCTHGQLICGGAIRRGPSVEEISEIPGKLDDIDSVLQIGNFSRNFITKIEEGSFVGLEKTRILDLSHNFISTIEDGAFQMGSPNIELRILYLSHNRIRQLSAGMFLGLDNLWQLYAEQNALRVIEGDAFDNMQELHVISLRNSLRYWDYSTRPFEPLDKLKMVYLAQTVYSSCTCGLLNLFDDVISEHITIMDEVEARKFCSRDSVTCATRSPMTTINYKAAGVMPPEELVPPVSDEGIITFEGESHSILNPEGKHLLKLYDVAMRRKIGEIRQRSIRAKYEHRFRLEMRKVVEKFFYRQQPVTVAPEEVHGTTSSNTIRRTTVSSPRIQSATEQTTKLSEYTTTRPPPKPQIVNPYKHLNRLLAKGFAKYRHKPRPTTEEPDAPAIVMAPHGYVDVGVIMGLVLFSIAVSFFAAAVAISVSMGWVPCRKRRDLLKDDDEPEPGCWGKITRKLAIRKKYLDSRGPTSPPKGKPYASFHHDTKGSTEERNLLKNLKDGPLPEDAIEALTREQRRRTLGGTSRASSEFTAFDSDSDSEQELFHEKHVFGS